MEFGRTRFQAGMRVSREHLDHLQDVLHEAIRGLRETGGSGRIVFGLRVTAVEADGVKVEPGYAVDGSGRPISLTAETPVAVDWGDAATCHLAIRHALRSGGLVRGVPTLLFDDAAIDVRRDGPPYDDGALPFARLDRDDATVTVTQRGDWYLPPLQHRHSGTFVERDGRWRYDGDPLGLPPARFDSGWVDEADVVLKHGLASADLVVQLQARRDGVITVEGLGGAYWYELPDSDHLRLVGKERGLELRAVAWPLDQPADAPPVADPGPDLVVDPGAPFRLDGRRSRAFGGRRIVKFIWTRNS